MAAWGDQRHETAPVKRLRISQGKGNNLSGYWGGKEGVKKSSATCGTRYWAGRTFHLPDCISICINYRMSYPPSCGQEVKRSLHSDHSQNYFECFSKILFDCYIVPKDRTRYGCKMLEKTGHPSFPLSSLQCWSCRFIQMLGSKSLVMFFF